MTKGWNSSLQRRRGSRFKWKFDSFILDFARVHILGEKRRSKEMSSPRLRSSDSQKRAARTAEITENKIFHCLGKKLCNWSNEYKGYPFIKKRLVYLGIVTITPVPPKRPVPKIDNALCKDSPWKWDTPFGQSLSTLRPNCTRFKACMYTEAEIVLIEFLMLVLQLGKLSW